MILTNIFNDVLILVNSLEKTLVLQVHYSFLIEVTLHDSIV